ncbi:MAG: SMI1/KNR4 family protein [Kofleriaceae bacterium]|nr:SMI1/KNR4 family protein [Kofleriaceae bacterium]
MSDQELDQVEKVLGLSLPNDYRQFMKSRGPLGIGSVNIETACCRMLTLEEVIQTTQAIRSRFSDHIGKKAAKTLAATVCILQEKRDHYTGIDTKEGVVRCLANYASNSGGTVFEQTLRQTTPTFEKHLHDVVVRQTPFTDFEEALATPDKVRSLELDGVSELPATFSSFTKLETLKVENIKTIKLPGFLADLHALRSIEILGNAKEISERIFALPYLVKLYCFGYPKGYTEGAINTLLTEAQKERLVGDERQLRAALLLGNLESASELGTNEMLLRALDSKLAKVRRAASLVLAEKHSRVALSIENAEVAVLGKLNSDIDVLRERLCNHEATITNKVGPNTTHVLVGERPKRAWEEPLKMGLVLFVERQLLDFLDEKQKPALVEKSEANTEVSSALSKLLLSGSVDNVKLAIEMMKSGGAPSDLLEELLLVAQGRVDDKEVQSDAMALFDAIAPPHVHQAITRLGKAKLYTPSETKVAKRIKQIAEDGEGTIDGTKLATLMLPEHGIRYLLQVAGKKDPDVALAALEHMRTNDELNLRGMELDRIPMLEELVGLRQLLLGPKEEQHNSFKHNNLKKLPQGLFKLSQLEVLELGDNWLTSIPDDLVQLTHLLELDLQNNLLAEFPAIVLKLNSLQNLNLSSNTSDRENRWGLSENIGELQDLQILQFRFREFESLPDSFRSLKKLRLLDLGRCTMKTLPRWLVEMPALESVHLQWVTVADKDSFTEVTTALQKRGVDVRT